MISPNNSRLNPGNRFTAVYLITGIAITISFLTRLILLVPSWKAADWTFLQILGSFGIGLFYDLMTASFIIIPFVLHLGFMSNIQYQRPWKWVITGIWLLLFLLVLLTNIIPKDFNKDLYHGVLYYLLARLLIHLLLSSGFEQFRFRWRKTFLYVDVFLVSFLLIFNAISEFFFWDEFSTRYNFIAVDYLVYTTEVIGNIRESYPVYKIIFVVLSLSIGIVYAFRKPLANSLKQEPPLLQRAGISLLLLLVPVLSYQFVTNKWKAFSQNEYANELAGNGMFDFATAFQNNELDFYKFYSTIPDAEAFRLVRQSLNNPYTRFATTDSFSIERVIDYPQPEEKLNVVLISVESLSADFMKAFGSTQNITPNLDSLAEKSLFFNRLYASGTRTVRGLEAMSLSIPPTPGQSLVKRPGNEDLFSLGSLFSSKGYITNYIYGGYSYFDNMNYFFGHNGYKVIDRSALGKDEIHYENIWGVADEDLFNLSLKVLDSNHAAGRPFFSQIMTVSNHRPFTYPEGRIDIPPSAQTRSGAVKYTDYAIGKFLRDASGKPWFDNTIFIVVADHCAGSAGSVELPVTGYHIPGLIFSPKHVQPRKIDRLVAQIDLLPTLLGLLHFDYTSKFFGQDIFAVPESQDRLFISTYQGLGYLKNGQLLIQKPVKQLEAYQPDFETGKATKIAIPDSLRKEAIAQYQVASWLIRNHKFGKISP